MYLSVHTLSGAVIGKSIVSPLWAFVLGFVFHFVMDLIPHGDGKMMSDYIKTKQKKKGPLIMIGVDIVLTIGLLIYFSSHEVIDFQITSVTYAIIGSLLPDVIVALHEILNLFPRFHKFHTFNHNYLMQKVTVNFLPGTILQVLLAIYLIRSIT